MRERAVSDYTECAIRSLPLPTRLQHRAFVGHLCRAHSWYKHLPLLAGGTFVVFLAPDAGESYPSEYPRLPYGNSSAAYRKAFGNLDYVWSTGGPYYRDGGVPPELPQSLLASCRFVLHPYVSDEFYWSTHTQAVAALRGGAPHPQRERLLAWEAASRAEDQAETDGPELSVVLRRAHRANSLHGALRIQEVLRIEEHLRYLYEWHGSQGAESGPSAR